MAQQEKKSYRIPRILFWGALWLGIAWAIAYGINIWQSIPSIESIEAPESFRSSKLYSADLKLLALLHKGENRETIELEEVSQTFIDALIATEDKRFYEHAGIDSRVIPAILWRYLRKDQVSGGSTISMQLARNLFPEIGRKRSIRRKLREIATALQLEKTYTKKEILTLYLNTVNIYGNCYGVETAAKRLFGKSASDLNWEESALMVGLLKEQGMYHPRKYAELALARRNTVLDLLVEQRKVDNIKADSIKQIAIQLVKEGEIANTRLAPHFVERSRLWLEKWGAANGYNIYQDGLEIYTTIDTRMQQHAEIATYTYLKQLQAVFDKHIKGKESWRKEPEILDRLMRKSRRYLLAKRAGLDEASIKQTFEQAVPMRIFSWGGEMDTVMSPLDSLKYYSRFLEVGMTVIEPGKGAVKAWVGGLDYDYFKYDHVELSKRQTGSTFKAFVYATALEQGFEPCSQFLNQRITVEQEEQEAWKPKNVGNVLGGRVSMVQALRYSYNLITARLTEQLTPKAVADYAQHMGIQSEVPAYPSIGLGTTELNVLELTAAYSTFVNQGEHHPPYFIAEIRDKTGKVLYQVKPQAKPAISKQTAYTMTQMLRKAGGNCGLKGKLRNIQKQEIAVGGKTGTTQDHSDGWFVGITPQLTAGIWVGCAERSMRFQTMKYGQGAYMARPIFGDFVERAYRDERLNLLRSDFYRPAGYQVSFDCWKEGIKYRSGGAKGLPEGLEGWEGR